jgi:hypothetical protein
MNRDQLIFETCETCLLVSRNFLLGIELAGKGDLLKATLRFCKQIKPVICNLTAFIQG